MFSFLGVVGTLREAKSEEIMTSPTQPDSTSEPSDDANEPATPLSRPRRFDPRIAMLTSLGAIIIVLAFALVFAFLTKDSTSTRSSDAMPVKTMQLKADDSTFTATTLPDAGLVTMDGKVTTLAEVANGKPTMINMFSSSCTACRTEMPDLEDLHQQAGQKMQIVGVDLGDSHAITQDFVKQTGVTYTIVRDPTSLLVNRLNITAQPMTLWVDGKGRIVYHRYGALSPAEMRLAASDHFGLTIPKA